jgi:predicted Zn-dependent peptidase
MGDNPVKVYKLENGMTLTVQRETVIPLVTVDMWVRVGSGDEPAEMAGISHYLEHMLFKGTQKLGVGDYDRIVEEAGGYLNAATSMDYTHYYVTVPTAHFEEILEHFADVLMNSTLDPAEVEMERQVILEEISRKMDTPFGSLFDDAIPAMFSSGPYRHPVIGTRDTVRATSQTLLREHYERFYTPDNMYLSIVGDVEPEAVRKKVEEYFAGFDRRLNPWRDSVPQTGFARPQEKVYTRDWNEIYFIIAFPGPSAPGMEEMALIDLLETLLASGRNSRLVNELQEKKKLVSNIGTYFMTSRHPSPLLIYGTCTRENLQAAREEIFNVLRDLGENGVKDSELRRVRRMALNSHLYSLETNAGRASTIGYSNVVLGNHALLDEYTPYLEKVSGKGMIEFVRKNLGEERSSFFVTGKMADGNGHSR